MFRRILRYISRKIITYSYVRNASSISYGKNSVIGNGVEIQAGHITIGDNSYIAGPARISSLPDTNISIGRYTSIASGVQIIGALHKSHITNYSLNKLMPIDQRHSVEHGITKGDIIIGSDVWIGTNAILLSGVRIGDGAIVAAGSIVTKDVPPYSVVMGVPASVKKYRFENHDIKKLLDLQWWNFDENIIKKNIQFFFDDDISITDFVSKFNTK